MDEKQIKNWYDFIPAKFEMVKISQRREVAFLKPVHIRALNLWKVDHLQKYLDLANYEDKHPNMYISVSRLKNIPIFTYVPGERQKETSVWFKKDYFKEVFAYDIFMDFDKEDGESWDEIRQEVKKLLEWFQEFKVPYVLIFSGNKGFQVVIDYQYLPEKLSFDVDENGKGKPGSIYEFTKIFQERIKEVFELKHLDLANNGIPNRLRKLPYSLVGDNVVLPLSDYDFNNWSIEKMHKDFVMKNIVIKNRGLLERKYELTTKQLKEGFLTFVREFKLK